MHTYTHSVRPTYTLASLSQEAIRTGATVVVPWRVEAYTRRTRCPVCTFIDICEKKKITVRERLVLWLLNYG